MLHLDDQLKDELLNFFGFNLKHKYFEYTINNEKTKQVLLNNAKRAEYILKDFSKIFEYSLKYKAVGIKIDSNYNSKLYEINDDKNNDFDLTFSLKDENNRHYDLNLYDDINQRSILEQIKKLSLKKCVKNDFKDILDDCVKQLDDYINNIKIENDLEKFVNIFDKEIIELFIDAINFLSGNIFDREALKKSIDVKFIRPVGENFLDFFNQDVNKSRESFFNDHKEVIGNLLKKEVEKFKDIVDEAEPFFKNGLNELNDVLKKRGI